MCRLVLLFFAVLGVMKVTGRQLRSIDPGFNKKNTEVRELGKQKKHPPPLIEVHIRYKDMYLIKVHRRTKQRAGKKRSPKKKGE